MSSQSIGMPLRGVYLIGWDAAVLQAPGTTWEDTEKNGARVLYCVCVTTVMTYRRRRGLDTAGTIPLPCGVIWMRITEGIEVGLQLPAWQQWALRLSTRSRQDLSSAYMARSRPRPSSGRSC